MRLRPLDALRGTIIIVMALDHANGLIARGKLPSEIWAGTFPDYQGDALAFLTRFVTHLAAPGFFFLMGAGMALFAVSRARMGWSRAKVIRFFMLRGSLLILLQFLLENPAWVLGKVTPPDTITYVGVLFALGSGMFLGSLWIFVPQFWLVTLSTVLVLGTELLLPPPSTFASGYPILQGLLMVPGYAPLGEGGLWVLYPILPWLGLVGLGLAYGRWANTYPDRSLDMSFWFGLLGLGVFTVLRLAGGYGNIRPIDGNSWIDFFNMVKYPPSLVFLGFTLGVNFLLLRLFSWLDRKHPSSLYILEVFGRVPLFFYLAHLYLYALIGLWLAPDGMQIPAMLPLWLLGLAVLYPLCRQYGAFKKTRPLESLWRMF